MPRRKNGCWMRFGSAGGAMQAVLEFAPPLPKTALEEKYSRPELYLICGDDTFQTFVPRRKWSETAAEVDERLRWSDGSLCAAVPQLPEHLQSTGSAISLELDATPERCDGGFGFCGPMRPTAFDLHRSVPEPANGGRTPASRFSARRAKGAKKFYELLGPAGPPHVAVAGLALKGRRCPRCDFRRFGHWIDSARDQLVHHRAAPCGRRRDRLRHTSETTRRRSISEESMPSDLRERGPITKTIEWISRWRRPP